MIRSKICRPPDKPSFILRVAAGRSIVLVPWLIERSTLVEPSDCPNSFFPETSISTERLTSEETARLIPELFALADFNSNGTGRADAHRIARASKEYWYSQ